MRKKSCCTVLAVARAGARVYGAGHRPSVRCSLLGASATNLVVQDVVGCAKADNVA